MAANDEDHASVKPSEQRGGSTPSPEEAADKGSWAGTAQDGLVPAELGGSDAPREMLADDPELGGETPDERAEADALDHPLDMEGAGDMQGRGGGEGLSRKTGASPTSFSKTPRSGLST